MVSGLNHLTLLFYLIISYLKTSDLLLDLLSRSNKSGLICYGSESRSREVVTGLREGTSERVFKPGIPPRNSSFFLSFRFSLIRSFSPESNRLRDSDDEIDKATY